MGAAQVGRPAALALGCLAAVAAIGVRGTRHGPVPGEVAVAERFKYEELSPAVARICELLHDLGSPPGAVTTTTVLAAWLAATRGRVAVLGLVLAGSAVVVSLGLREALGPTLVDERFQPRTTSGSYPSTHVVWSTAVLGFAAGALVRGRRPVLAAPLVVVVASMPVARLLDGSHYVSDVVAGVLLGGGWAAAALAVTLPSRPPPPVPYRSAP